MSELIGYCIVSKKNNRVATTGSSGCKSKKLYVTEKGCNSALLYYFEHLGLVDQYTVMPVYMMEDAW